MSRLAPTDLVRVASRGLRGHPLRFLLSALGIAIGVAAMVAVVGTTQSSRGQLNDLLSRLGTNLVKVYPAPDLRGEATTLPSTAATMLGRVGPVHAASGVGELEGVGVYRTDLLPSGNTNSLVVAAADANLLETLKGTLAVGHWFTPANESFPTVVLGSAAAERLAVDDLGTRLWIADQWWVVVGILDPLPLAPDLDGAAVVPARAAAEFAGHDGRFTAVYVRTAPEQVGAVSAVVPATASPERPEVVGISRPTDALQAQLAADDTLNRLLLGLSAIGLLVGGVGISNTMVIAVIERRAEIGLRRALGATRGNIASQFLAESALMSLAGGVVGAFIGCVVTVGYANVQGWGVQVPLVASIAAAAATMVVGTLAGLYPAVRASLVAPAMALANG